MFRKLLGTIAASLCAIVTVHADVTVQYQTEIKSPNPMLSAFSAKLPTMEFSMHMKNGKSWCNMGPLTPWTFIVDYNIQQATLIDKEHKTFTTLPLNEFADKMTGAMPSMSAMPEEAKKAMAQIKISVESRKPSGTETIQGIQAQEEETVISVANPSLKGQGDMKLVIRYWRATPEETLRNQAVREFTGYGIWANRLTNPAEMMKKIFGAMGSDSFQKLFDEISKNEGMILRTQMEMRIQLPPEMVAKLGSGPLAGMDPNAPLFQMTQEIKEISTAPVDDAIFQVPSDYQQVAAEELLKSGFSAMQSSMKPDSCHMEAFTKANTASQPASDSKRIEQARKDEQEARKILESDPNDVEAKRRLAVALFRQDKIEESAEIMKSMHGDGSPGETEHVAPPAPDPKFIEQVRQNEEASRKILESDPNNVDAKRQLANSLLMQQKIGDAMKVIQTIPCENAPAK